jgi:hypothetical protein
MRTERSIEAVLAALESNRGLREDSDNQPP